MTMNCTWYEYSVTEERDGAVVSEYVEKYVLNSKCGKKTVFELFRDGESRGQFVGSTDYANGHFRNDRLVKKGTESVMTMDGQKELDVFVSDRCGGSTTVYQDEEGLMYRGIGTQMWSRGVIVRIIRNLVGYG